MNSNESTVQYLRDKYGKSVLSVKELATEMGLNRFTIYSKIANDEHLPEFIKIGRKIIFPIESVANYLNKKAGA